MKILLLPSYFLPEGVSSPYISWNRNQAFADEGWNIVVYTPVPSRGITPEIRTEYKKKKLEVMFNGKMVVHRFNLIAEGKNPVIRAFRYFVQNIKQFCKAVFAKDGRSCDVMLIASTPPTQGAMAVLIKFLTKKPLVYNLQDIFPDSLVGAGMTRKGSLLWKVGRIIENFTYKYCDKIIVISEGFKQNLLDKGVPKEKIEIIYNWVETNKIIPIAKEDNLLYREFGLDQNKFTVVYAGNLGNAQNIDIIVDAAVLLKHDKDIQFVIFGTGGLEESIRERISSEHLVNMILLPLQSYERISYVYSLGDVCIVSCKAGLGGSAMPSKTWSIMSCGRPVVASFDEGGLKDILESNDCGVFTQAGDLRGFVDAIKILSANRERCVTMGMAGRKFILDNLTKEVGTQKYVDVIKCVIENK